MIPILVVYYLNFLAINSLLISAVTRFGGPKYMSIYIKFKHFLAIVQP